MSASAAQMLYWLLGSAPGWTTATGAEIPSGGTIDDLRGTHFFRNSRRHREVAAALGLRRNARTAAVLSAMGSADGGGAIPTPPGEGD